jgi:hypothetical protein
MIRRGWYGCDRFTFDRIDNGRSVSRGGGRQYLVVRIWQRGWVLRDRRMLCGGSCCRRRRRRRRRMR